MAAGVNKSARTFKAVTLERSRDTLIGRAGQHEEGKEHDEQSCRPSQT